MVNSAVMTTGHVLMGLLRRGQQHGYDLKRRHDEVFPSARPMAFGQVYAALGRLVDKGWVRPAATEQEGGPERTVFELTDAGMEEVRIWSRSPEVPRACRRRSWVHWRSCAAWPSRWRRP